MRRAIGLTALLLLVACGADGRDAPLTDAIVRVEVEPCRGGPVGRATAFAVSTYGLLTVAHAFDGVGSFTVRDAAGEGLRAELVHLDADLDVAVLRSSEPLDDPLPLGASTSAGEAVALSAGDVDGFDSAEVVVRRRAMVSLDGGPRRRAIEIEADVVPGDSGGPVIVDDQVVAMVFASSRRSSRGWALDATELRATLEAADVSTPVPLACG